MKRGTAITWMIVLGLLIGGPVLTALWPQISEQLGVSSGSSLEAPDEEAEEIVFEVEQQLLGEELLTLPVIGDFLAENVDGTVLTQLEATLILVVITFGGLGAIGVPLAIIYTRLDAQTTAVKESNDYKEAEATLSNRHKEKLKEIQQAKPTTGPEKATMPRWSVISTALVVLIFVWLTSLAVAQSFLPQEMDLNGQIIDPASPFSWLMVLITALGLYFMLRGRGEEGLDLPEGDNQPVNWGWLWVILSGMLVVGLGMGLAANLWGAS